MSTAANLWSAFLSALNSRGLSFDAVALTTDVRSVIVAAGFQDALDLAVIETTWAAQLAAQGNVRKPAPPSSGGPSTLLLGTASRSEKTSAIALSQLPPTSSLRALPGEMIDAIVADECLHALLGFSGAFISVVPVGDRGRSSGIVFSPEVPTAMRNVIEPVVGPLAQALLSLQAAALAECSWRSVVNMAVGEVLREVCCAYKRDVKAIVQSLDGKPKPLALVLAQGWQIGYPMLRLAQVFDGDCDPVKGKLMGAKLLDHIFDQYTRAMGSADDAALLSLVLRRAASPYLDILRKWVNFGILADPHQEFFVREQDFQSTVDPRVLWEQRFQRKKSDVPSFLRREQLEGIVLTSGKLCHTLRECGAAVPAALEGDDAPWQWTDASELVANVLRAHESASQALQGLIIDQFSLIQRLVSLKHYFLLDRGDWLAAFLDTAADVIYRPPSQVKAYTLNVMVQAEVAKACPEDSFHGDVGCSLTEITFLTKAIAPSQSASGVGDTRASMGRMSMPVGITHDTRRAIDHLQLEYTCPWPVPIVIDPKFIADLNIVFRLLLRLKTTERALLFSKKRMNSQFEFTPLTRRLFHLTHLLQQFITQFQFHATHAVIEPTWAVFIQAVKSSGSLRDIVEAKRKLIDSVYQGLALSNKQRIRALALIIDLALKFAALCARCLGEDSQASRSASSSSAAPPDRSAEERAVAHMHEQFGQLLSELAKAEDRDYGAFLPFLVTLDFNGFYERTGVYRVRPGAVAEAELGSWTTEAASRRSTSTVQVHDHDVEATPGAEDS